MKRVLPLTDSQRQLVEQNQELVRSIAGRFVSLPELEFDDLFQEGCLWLCKAAATYQENRGATFITYANKVVINGLKTYCRVVGSKRKKQYLYTLYDCEQSPTENEADKLVTDRDMLRFLNQIKQQYAGTVRLGIEALEWKLRDYSGTEIAKMYGVTPNLVGAWISRAAQKLRKNKRFLTWMERLGDRKAS